MMINFLHGFTAFVEHFKSMGFFIMLFFVAVALSLVIQSILNVKNKLFLPTVMFFLLVLACGIGTEGIGNYFSKVIPSNNTTSVNYDDVYGL